MTLFVLEQGVDWLDLRLYECITLDSRPYECETAFFSRSNDILYIIIGLSRNIFAHIQAKITKFNHFHSMNLNFSSKSII